MPQEMIRVGLVGVTGYTGMELARLLTGHPNMKLTAATSRTEAGKRLGDLYPFLNGLPGADVILIEPEPELIAKECDLAFLAVRKAIAGAQVVGNPGCYPTSIILGMTAALADGLIETHGIVADSKSGVSGAGRSAKLGSLYCEVADSFKAYGIGTHRHTPEIEQELSRLAHEPMTISFNPHLVPMNRGILSTIYAQLKAPLSQADAQRVYEETWADSPWVRVLPSGQLPETRNVRGTMFCDMSVIVDPRTNRLIVVSVIDNVCRGASGQAIANANIMCGLPVTTGLMLCAMMP